MTSRPDTNWPYRLLVLLVATLLVTATVPASVLAAGESEPNDTIAEADALVVGEATTGSLSNDDTVDVFSFSATRGQQLLVQSSRSSALAGSVRVRIYEVNNGNFGPQRAGDTIRSGESETFGDVLERTGTYVAYVTGDPGAYSFTVTLSSTTDAEPNDVLSDATAYTLGTTVTGPLGYGDIDIYEFTATRGQELVVTTSLPSTEQNSFRLRVYEDNNGGFGPQVASETTRPGDAERFGATLQRTGTYYVYLTGEDTEYTFTVRLNDLDPTEPNDILADATDYTVGSTIAAPLTTGDVDAYQFEADRGQELVVTTSLPSTEQNSFRLRVYEDDNGGFGPQVASETTRPGDAERFGATLQQTGIYYVYVTGDPTNYTFRIRLNTLENEPNDVLADATPYDVGVEESSRLTQGDIDVYAFEGVRGAELKVLTSVESTEQNSFRLRVYEDDDGGFGPQIASGTTSPGESEVFGATVERDGRHYVYITGDPTNYTFTLEMEVLEFYEPNERTSDATAFLPNPVDEAILGVGDDDYYSLRADAGETVTVNVSRASTEPDSVRLRVYENNGGNLGTQLFGVTADPGETRGDQFQARYSGTYFVLVTGDAGPYGITASVDGSAVGVPNDRFELNEDVGQAAAVTLGRYDDLRIVDTDVDVFAVDLEAGDELNAGILYDTGLGTLTLSVLDGTGALVATGSATGTGAAATYVAPADGTYHVSVQGSGTDEIPYDLTLRVPLTVSLSPVPQRVTLGPGETTTFAVLLSGADVGLSSYEFTAELSNTTPVTITGATVPAGVGDSTVTVAPDGSNVTVNATGVTFSTTGPTEIATVTLDSTAIEGASDLRLAVDSVLDDTGAAYGTSPVDGTVVVVSGPGDLVGDGNEARDLDGDGLFEDVDGNGRFEFFDVIGALFLLDQLDRATGAFLDFDGDGRFGFLDVIDLLFRL